MMTEIHNKKTHLGRKHIYNIDAFFSFWEDTQGYHAELFVPKLEKTFRVISNVPEAAKEWMWREAHDELDWHACGVIPREEYGFAYDAFKASKPKPTFILTWIPGSFEDKIQKIFDSELKRTGATWYNDVDAWYDRTKPDYYYDRDEDPVSPGFSVNFWRSHYVLKCGEDTLEKYIITYCDPGYIRFFIMAIQWLRKFPSLPPEPTPEELYEEGIREIDAMDDCPDWLKDELKRALAKPENMCR